MRKSKLGYWAISALIAVLGGLAAIVFASGFSLSLGLVLLSLAVALLPVGAYLGMRETLYAFRSFGLLEQVVQLRQEVSTLRNTVGVLPQQPAQQVSQQVPAVTEVPADLEKVIAELRQEVRLLRLMELDRP